MPELIYPYNLLHKVYDTSYPTDLNEDQMEGCFSIFFATIRNKNYFIKTNENILMLNKKIRQETL